MKKKLEAELMSIAHRILQLKNKADVHELKAVTGVLYEKLSVLSFTEKHFEGPQPTLGKKHIEEALEKESPSSIPAEEKNRESSEKDARPDGTAYNPEAITEPNTEKIKDIVAQMPPESEKVDEVLEKILPEENQRANKNLFDIGVHYDDLPQFEPVSKQAPKADKATPEEKKDKLVKPTPKETEKNGDPFSMFERKEKATKNEANPHKKSLNDRLKKGINIGLNDRLAYIKHLFDGNAADYNRVLSQLNTIEAYGEAKNFIEQVVKPDYNHWENKEEYENRFLQAIENKFE